MRYSLFFCFDRTDFAHCEATHEPQMVCSAGTYTCVTVPIVFGPGCWLFKCSKTNLPLAVEKSAQLYLRSLAWRAITHLMLRWLCTIARTSQVTPAPRFCYPDTDTYPVRQWAEPQRLICVQTGKENLTANDLRHLLPASA